MFVNLCRKLMIKKGFSRLGVFFLYAISLFPLPVLHFFALLLYFPLYHLVGYRKQVVRENLAKSFPEKSKKELLDIEQKFYRFLCEMIFEVIKMSTVSLATLNKRVTFKNLDLVEQHFQKGESVLACTGHSSNWEFCMLALGANLSAKEYVIYKPLKNEVFEDWFYKIRTRFGNEFVTMRQTIRSVISTKNETTMFCFASDQTPVRAEVQHRLTFLNQSTPVLLGLEKIAIQTNRPVFYFDVKRIKSGYYEIECIPMVSVPKETREHEITERFFDCLTKTISRQPAYWLWSHRRWKLND